MRRIIVKKRGIAALVSALLICCALLITGCGGKDTAASSEEIAPDEAVEEAAEKTEDAGEDAAEKTEDAGEDAAEKTEDAGEKAAEKREDAGEDAAEKTEDAGEDAAPKEAEAEAENSVEKNLDEMPRAVITVEKYGPITVALDAEAAPATVENFIKLAKSGFYDGLTFHRIMDGFMIQGGDPSGNGTGGSDETIKGEFAINGFDNPISHVKGIISMARAQDPDSASSQFFITVADSTFLDGQYAAFGYVTDGMDVADQIAKDAQPIDGNGTIPPEAQPVITSIVIEE